MSFPKIRVLARAIALAFPAVAQPGGQALAADENSVTLAPVTVIDSKSESPLGGSTLLDRTSLLRQRAASSDSARLLGDVPGVSLYGAGGVSSLPAIHGLADDRLRIKVDGMDLIASCPNHMNSPLSSIDPTNVGSVRVYTGITPVSVGGDSIGGSIVVDTPAPVFAAPGQGSLMTGEMGAFRRSNGNAWGANLSATYATESFSATYSASSAKADNYQAGSDYKTLTATGRPGQTVANDVVGSTAYNSRNQTLGFALRGDNHLVEARFGYQDIPYELYPNQRMDMLGNTQHRFSLRYLGQFDGGTLEARVYREKVDHKMDFGPDRKLNYGSLTGTSGTVWSVDGMPMYTEGKTDGASVKTEMALTQRDQLRVGGDLQHYHLDDWWPPAPDCGVGECIGGMAPLAFSNINGGKRDRLGLFGEWEAAWNPQWLSLLGVRVERVTADTGPVTGYFTQATPLANALGMMRSMYETSSVGTRAAFNAMDRKRSDNNIDLTALLRNTPDANRTYEFGYAQKTRSPNLYERYSWSKNGMALEMNNFVGDGNGYLGNPDLKPEVAQTLSFTADWHSDEREYELKATPYFTQVSDYIDAIRIPNATTTMYVNGVLKSVPIGTLTNGFVFLQYANQSARLYGIDLSAKLPLGKTAYGDWGLKGMLNYTSGKNLDTGDHLYHIMPFNTRLTLTHKSGGWDNGLDVVGVQAKDDVSAVRNEVKTSGYGLVNLRGSYSWKQIRVDFGVENLFDRYYELPLGGAYTGQGASMSFNREGGAIGNNGGTAGLWGIAVPGMGRSIYAGITAKF